MLRVPRDDQQEIRAIAKQWRAGAGRAEAAGGVGVGKGSQWSAPKAQRNKIIKHERRENDN